MTAKQLWIVKAIWVLIVIVLCVVLGGEALILLVGLLFIRPVVREIRPCSDLDERQNLLFLKGGYYGFLTAMFLIVVVFMVKSFVQHEEPAPEWWLVLSVPLVVNGSFYLWRAAGMRRIGLVLGFLFGGIWTAFTLASHGFSLESLMESVVGLSILVPTFVALKWPRIGGTLLMIAAIVMIVFFGPMWWKRMNGPLGIVLMLCVLPLPVLLAGLCLFRYGVIQASETAPETGKSEKEMTE